MNTINFISKIDTIAKLSKRQKTYREIVDPFLIPEDQFKIKYRFNKSTVRKIINLVKPELELDKRGRGTSVQLQVLVALQCWGQRELQNDAAVLHGLAQATVSRSCARVARALVRLGNTKIKMPLSLAEEQTLMKDFKSIKKFPEVIGIITDTHIEIQRKAGDDLPQYYITMDGYYSLNVQIVCDAKLMIRDIEVGLRGSTQDCGIFNKSTIKQRFENDEFSGHLLGDSGYELHSYIFTPLPISQNDKELNYNAAHFATRSLVERCIRIWKQRFRCLHDFLRISIENSKTLIVALAVLHNIALEENDLVPDDDKVEEKKQDKVEENLICYNDNRYPLEESTPIVLQNFIQKHF